MSLKIKFTVSLPLSDTVSCTSVILFPALAPLPSEYAAVFPLPTRTRRCCMLAVPTAINYSAAALSVKVGWSF